MSEKLIASFLFDCQKFGASETIWDPEDLTKDHKLLILHGGEDISPSIYGEAKGPAQAGNTPSHRDIIEMDVLNTAIDLGVPVLAICRGAQLACAMLGGSLYQDVDSHFGDHMLEIKQSNGDPIRTTTNSCHHQMMIPDPHAKILATAGYWKVRRWRNDRKVEEGIEEPEVVLWETEKVLGVQGHPEWSHTQGAHAIFAYTKAMLHQHFGV
jgi:gamma-glutamyl-gamma-aminobutyrate hydrolase PuuD